MSFVATEEERRRKESGFAAIGFKYGNSAPAVDHKAASSNLSLPEHPSTASVDHGEEDSFIPPAGLRIPEGIQAVSATIIIWLKRCELFFSLSSLRPTSSTLSSKRQPLLSPNRGTRWKLSSRQNRNSILFSPF